METNSQVVESEAAKLGKEGGVGRVQEVRDSSTRSRRRERSGSRKRDRCSRDRKRRRRHRRRHSSSRSSSSGSSSSSRSGGRNSSREKRRGGRRESRYSSSSRTSMDNFRGQTRPNRCTNDSYKYQEPNSTVMVRGLATLLNENDIHQEVLKCGIIPKEIRLIRSHETGVSRGFAFVEFKTISDACLWMETNKGALLLRDKFPANLIYSMPKACSNGEEMSNIAEDWICYMCDGNPLNFKRRDFCYKCNSPRPIKDQSRDLGVSSQPTTFILLTNLDALTTEEKVLQAFQTNPKLASIPIKTVKIVRDPVTKISSGKCCVESNNISEAIQLFSTLKDETLEIDGRIASVAYGKGPSLNAKVRENSAAAMSAVAAAQWTNSGARKFSEVTFPGPPCQEVKTEKDAEEMARYCSQLYAKTFDDYTAYLDYYRKFYHGQLKKESSAALPSDTAICQSQNRREDQQETANSNIPVGSQAHLDWSNKHSVGAKLDSVDMSRFKYDNNSGYYYDSVTGLYYDATRQYFYDAQNQVFLQWNSLEGKYVVVTSEECSGESKTSEGVEEVKLENEQVAKKISKNMEKWAKTLNQTKERKPNASTGSVSSLLDSSKSYSKQDSACDLANIYLGPQKSKECLRQEKVESKDDCFVDEKMLACLLCKRKFTSKEVLEKHLQMSTLHKTNLELLGQSQKSDPIHVMPGLHVPYRDRAQERREIFNYSSNDDCKKTVKKICANQQYC